MQNLAQRLGSKRGCRAGRRLFVDAHLQVGFASNDSLGKPDGGRGLRRLRRAGARRQKFALEEIQRRLNRRLGPRAIEARVFGDEPQDFSEDRRGSVGRRGLRPQEYAFLADLLRAAVDV